MYNFAVLYSSIMSPLNLRKANVGNYSFSDALRKTDLSFKAIDLLFVPVLLSVVSTYFILYGAYATFIISEIDLGFNDTILYKLQSTETHPSYTFTVKGIVT